MVIRVSNHGVELACHDCGASIESTDTRAFPYNQSNPDPAREAFEAAHPHGHS